MKIFDNLVAENEEIKLFILSLNLKLFESKYSLIKFASLKR